MTYESLKRRSDHDLLVRLNVLLDDHLEEHREGKRTFRWSLGILLGFLTLIVGAAGVVASWGNP